jgi:hypothetical protein
MASLGNFLQGFETARQGNLQADSTNIQQAGALQGLQAKFQAAQQALEAQQQERDYRTAIAAAKTPEEKLAIAQRFMGANQLGSSIQTAQTKDAQIAATADAAANRVTQQEINANNMHEWRMQSLVASGANNAARQEEIARHNKVMEEIARLRAEQAKAQNRPFMSTDERGNVRLISPTTGAVVGTAPNAGKPSEAYVKRQEAIRKSKLQLDEAVTELEKAVVPGGLIDKSTGSGIGAGIDVAGRMIGYATPGGIAAGQLAPIFDLVLKMVPRFEGPQSDKDTATYKDAAGQLANPNIPNTQKKAAASTILRLMKARRGQFVTQDADVGAPSADGGWEDL